MEIFALGVITSIIGGLLIPSIREAIFNFFKYAYKKFSGDLIDLTDLWESNFCEKDDTDCTFTTVEKIHLRQKGKDVYGDGEIGQPYPRRFKFRGTQYQELFYGYYAKEGTKPGSLEGKGVFLLKIDPNRNKMSGYCSWYDLHSGNIEKSSYEWKRL